MARSASHAAKRNDRLERSKGLLSAVWADRLSRVCALAGATSIWVTVTLTEPAFVVPLLAAAFGIWFLRGRRAELREAAVDDDDWL